MEIIDVFKGNFAKENTLELSILFLSSLGGLPIACVPMSHHQQRAESTLGFTLIILYLLNLHCWVVVLSGVLSVLICVTADTLSMLWLWLCRSGKEAFGERTGHLFLELLCFVPRVSAPSKP